MQGIVFFIIKIFFVILAVSVIGLLAAVILRKPKEDSCRTLDKKRPK